MLGGDVNDVLDILTGLERVFGPDHGGGFSIPRQAAAVSCLPTTSSLTLP